VGLGGATFLFRSGPSAWPLIEYTFGP
jgi:hypothetical protein